MRALLAVLLAAVAAVDGGVPTPDAGHAPAALRNVEVKNLGASAVQLLLQRADGTYAWGPFELASHETIQVSYCPCAGLSLELRSPIRAKPRSYPLKDLSALLLSEDRWSEGEPLVRRDPAASASCPAGATCDGPPFRIHH